MPDTGHGPQHSAASTPPARLDIRGYSDAQANVIKKFAQDSAKLHAGKAIAFCAVINPWPKIGGIAILGLNVLGEDGFHPMHPDTCTGAYDEVSATADRLNKALGIDMDTGVLICADVMNRSRAKSERRAGIVRVPLAAAELESILALIDADDDDNDDLSGKLNEALAETKG